MIERWQSVRRTTPTAVYVATGVSWLAAVFWVVIGNVIVRETPAGKLAQQIDRLPPLLAKPNFRSVLGPILPGLDRSLGLRC